jgi:predicted RNA binding protein YcfA (HicA-like mRNA interferase family)
VPRKIRELKADLQREGFMSRTAKGSHTFWAHDLLPDRRVALSGHDGDDAQRYQEREVRAALHALRRARRKVP